MNLTKKNLELAIAEAIIKLLRVGIDRWSDDETPGDAVHSILYDLHPGIVHHFGHGRNKQGKQLQVKIEEMIESVAVFLGKDKVEKAKLARKRAGKDDKIKSLKDQIRQVEKEKKSLLS